MTTLLQGLERRTFFGRNMLAALGAVAVCAIQAIALPAPKSIQTLEKESDIVATVRVLAVVQTGEATYGRVSTPVPTYQAWLQVTQATKGPVKSGETLLVGWHGRPKGLIGGWHVDYFPGEEVKTYLRWNAKDRIYQTTWYNAKSKPLRPTELEKLPSKSGGIVVAKDLSAEAAKK